MSSVLGGGGRKATEDFFLERFSGRTGRADRSFAVREGSNDFRVRLSKDTGIDRFLQRRGFESILKQVRENNSLTEKNIKANSSPLRRNLEAARSRLRRGFERRNLQGSSIVEGFLNNQQREDELQVADFETRLRQQLQTLNVSQQRQVLADLNNLTQQALNEEFTALGLTSGVQTAIQGGENGGGGLGGFISDAATVAAAYYTGGTSSAVLAGAGTQA